MQRINGGRPAFTLVEVVLALIVACLVFFGLANLHQAFHASEPNLGPESLQVACQQLQDQGYRLKRVERKRIVIVKEGDQQDDRRLQQHKNQLVVDGRHNGRMVVLGNIRSFAVIDHGSYQELRARSRHGLELKGLLFLPRITEEADGRN
ncbi:hypothetical protein LQZ24_05335 [Fructobacillus sp. M1-13]|uniref:Prepilin-type N-terminal cleavage/methylation domain-containing protein n=1 Tax=Fructobacillus papyriferae TaxID=2713171 RepID=A0ABS5QPJ1_9LACO|nr:hypothetical protein [Fructobacillus papyriferae]MBS9335095.1 hypothetical protein [Fructobacillus papyriferae]MCD2159419.1 hypothetical protein [Fructobacillus papyriferae]